ncbi:MAG: hypothetical protein CMH48_06570 [Muricauda sp.]|nr:hypothetical protein [Allomuricauda sp.]MBC30494.1 hypothetical protein [Allomuricauda sp.]
MAVAQEDNILGAIMEAAAAQENAANQGQSEADSAAQSEAAEAWKEAWEEMMEQNGEVMDALDTKYLKCTAMMVLYVYAYLKLVKEHKLGDLTMSECDALGMQTLAMASSTFIMYCPEEIDGLDNDAKLRIIRDLAQKLWEITPKNRIVDEERSPSSLYGKLLWIERQLTNYAVEYDGVDIDSETIEELEDFNNQHGDKTAARGLITMSYLIEFFKPRYIIPRTLQIAQEMEALGCSKPN